MAIATERNGTLSILHVEGPLTSGVGEDLAAAMAVAAAERVTGVVIDLTRATTDAGDPTIGAPLSSDPTGDTRASDDPTTRLCLSLADAALVWPGIPTAVLTGIDLARKLVADGVGRRLRIAHSLDSAAAALRADTDWRRASLALPPSLEAPGQARRFVAERLSRWRLGSATDAATLLASELTTNAVTHARTFLDVQLTSHDRYLAVSVTDRSDRLVSPRRPATGDESGHGLVVVSAVADRWGQSSTGPGAKSVWAVLYPAV